MCENQDVVDDSFSNYVLIASYVDGMIMLNLMFELSCGSKTVLKTDSRVQKHKNSRTLSCQGSTTMRPRSTYCVYCSHLDSDEDEEVGTDRWRMGTDAGKMMNSQNNRLIR
ncbi:transmembrane protein, putative [Medicago truncatula]|uniref:Transmembrane protein, putative n=1 Tax=Medicago truncatula TaxID=3880 RepID=A0A072TKD2_MEDTR|nr:transmembrane protein, putative [Medicago truncatula]